MLVNMPGKRQPTSSTGFARRLREARQQAELSGPELAQKLGLERSAIPQYEAGRTLPSMTVLQNMARVLSVSLDWLCFDEHEAVNQVQDKELLDYVLKADRLSHRDRSLVKDFIDSLLARAKLEEMKDAARNNEKAA